MKELIEKLEKATGPDRELDVCISTTLWPSPLRGSLVLTESVRPYTASVDAALTLVPEGWHVTHAWCNATEANVTLGSEKRERGWKDGKSTKPAIALCIASLRARQEKI